jgi:hypothetical protein
MLAAPIAQHRLTIATVPLRCEYLRQASLFEEETYQLPTVLPGERAVIFDADDWTHNFKQGTVTAYNHATGLHTIRFDSTAEGTFKGWEIIKAFGS